MAEQLRISSRAYSDLERGKYTASAPTLMFLFFHAGCGSAGRSGPAVYETCSGTGGDGCSMNAVTDIAEVYDLLYRLGFSATNTAFFSSFLRGLSRRAQPTLAGEAIAAAISRSGRPVQRKPTQVVRSIDGFACASWHKNAVLLRSLTSRPLTAAPPSTIPADPRALYPEETVNSI